MQLQAAPPPRGCCPDTRTQLRSLRARGLARCTAAAQLPSPLALPAGYSLRVASSSAEFRAAAAVRAAAFYTYPADRAFAAAAHQRMKVDAEWQAIENKTSGKDPAYAGVRVTCLICAAPVPADAADAATLCEGLDASCRVPLGDGGGVEVVLATLDVNRGATLPAEELGGTRGGSSSRAYLSNVSVAPGARRRGLAAALILAAEARVAAAGVRHLYVHCVADNAPAAALYAASGFAVEAEETAVEARALGRPRRLLFHKQPAL